MTTQQPDHKILQRIQKALNLANSKDDSESQTAMLLAQQLMAKHGLDMEDFDTSNPLERKAKMTADDVIEMYVTPPTKLQWWQKDLCSIVGDNFRCYAFWRTIRGRSRILFLGSKEDSAIAREVYLFAQKAIEYLSIKYLDERGITDPSDRNTLRNDYIKGFLSGLSTKFKEQVAEQELSLVLVKNDAVVEVYSKKKMRTDSPSTAQRSGDGEAMISGYNDGRSLDHNRKALPSK